MGIFYLDCYFHCHWKYLVVKFRSLDFALFEQYHKVRARMAFWVLHVHERMSNWLYICTFLQFANICKVEFWCCCREYSSFSSSVLWGKDRLYSSIHARRERNGSCSLFHNVRPTIKNVCIIEFYINFLNIKVHFKLPMKCYPSIAAQY